MGLFLEFINYFVEELVKCKYQNEHYNLTYYFFNDFHLSGVFTVQDPFDDFGAQPVFPCSSIYVFDRDSSSNRITIILLFQNADNFNAAFFYSLGVSHFVHYIFTRNYIFWI